MRRLSEILTLFFILIVFATKAQQTTFDQVHIIYQRQWTIGAFIHTRGWGLDYKIGKNITGFKKRIWEFEALTMKHPKEIRQYNPYLNNTKGYFYGKMNSLYILRGGIGLKNIFAPKQSDKGVAISYIASIGASLALAKPIYLVIMQQDDPYHITYMTEKYDPEKDFVDNIYGRASGLMGIGEIKPYPGLYGKFGLNFEYGKDQTDIEALEVGVAVDAYGKKIPIMAPSLTYNNQFFFTMYINLKIGGRHNDH